MEPRISIITLGVGFALTAWLWSSLSALALTVGIGWLAIGGAYSVLRGDRPAAALSGAFALQAVE